MIITLLIIIVVILLIGPDVVWDLLLGLLALALWGAAIVAVIVVLTLVLT